MPASSVSTILDIPTKELEKMGFKLNKRVHYQLTPAELTEQAVERGEGVLNDTGALVIRTGEFTGRSPKDKFIVMEELSKDSVHWNDFNVPIEPKFFDQLYNKLVKHLDNKELWVRDC